MFGLVAFFFADDELQANRSEATIVPTGLQVGNSGTVVKLTHVDELRMAILELLDQPAGDGIADTEKTITGATAAGTDLLVRWTPSTDKITVGSQVAWARTKAVAFCGGLVQFQLVVLAP